MGKQPFHDLIRYFYARVRGSSFKPSGQPAWIDTNLYDIQAISTFNEQKIVLQQLLADYLKLQVHEDTALYPYYGLAVSNASR